jgi:hypothetical protein
MPWTRKQVKYLFSKGSPLSNKQKNKMEGELHANPKMGYAKKKQHHHSANDGSFIDNRRGL